MPVKWSAPSKPTSNGEKVAVDKLYATGASQRPCRLTLPSGNGSISFGGGAKERYFAIGVNETSRLSCHARGGRAAGQESASVRERAHILEMVKKIQSRNLNNGGGRQPKGGPWLGES